jgi:2-keto-3-deoxy-L-rhamnonate aldolase RhmA
MINFRELLSSGDILCGTMVTLASSEVVEALAHIGFDWLFVDAEHSPLSAIAVRDIIQTAGSTPCLVRIASKEKVQIQQALDAGAAGIIVPSVNTAQDAQYIVDCVKYPPNGSRGIGLSRANTYGLRFYEYLEKANQELAVVIQAEHIDAVNNIETICSVEGIDGVFVGPYDLSASLNKTGLLDDKEVVSAIEHVRDVCMAKKMPLGFFGVDAADVSAKVAEGFTLLCSGLDISFMTSGAQDTLVRLREGEQV